jgi:hypothetical protein
VNFNMNKLFQIMIVTLLLNPAKTDTANVITADDNFPKTKAEKIDIISNEKADCKLPFIKSDDTTLEYANNGKTWQRVLDIMPLKDGTYMEITLDSPGAINFERYFANSSSSIAKDGTMPVALNVYFGPQAKPGVMLPFEKFYKIGTFTGNKMYFSIPIDQDVYVTTDNDVMNKGELEREPK